MPGTSWSNHNKLTLTIIALRVISTQEVTQTRWAVYIQLTTVTRSCNLCCHGNTICIKYSECVSVFLRYLNGLQIASSMHVIILSSAACLAVPYFPTLSQKQHDLQKEVTEHKTRVFDSTCNFCLKHFSFWQEFGDRRS